jgi:hypothetical protein
MIAATNGTGSSANAPEISTVPAHSNNKASSDRHTSLG